MNLLETIQIPVGTILNMFEGYLNDRGYGKTKVSIFLYQFATTFFYSSYCPHCGGYLKIA